MKCDQCDNVASVHLTQVVNGKMKKLHLCESCSSELGVGQGGFSVSDILLGKGVAKPLAGVPGNRACPECGWTLRKLRKKGRLGCSGCYEAFEKELKGILYSIHHATEHKGRVPKSHGESLSIRNRLDDLKSRISEAVADEKYEQAAKFRDEVQQLQDSLDSEESS